MSLEQTLQSSSWLATWLILFGIIVIRYFMIAGAAFWLTRRWGKEKWISKKIQEREPHPQIIRREILWSIASSLIFAASGVVGLWAYQHGYIEVYTDPQKYGLWYLPFSFGVLMFLHDAYFYWMHRAVHHPRWFKLVHQVHHDSITPTPFAAFSFHPLEAILEAFILPALLWMIPVHLAVLGTFLLTMTLLGVINHLGFEFYSKDFDQKRWTSWLISATNHDLHHQRFRGNYGLYFTWWDRWMNTALNPTSKLARNHPPSPLADAK